MTNHFASVLAQVIGEATIKDFAERIGVARSNLGRYLDGSRLPDPASLASIIRCIDTSCKKSELVTAWVRDTLAEINGMQITIEFDGAETPNRRLPSLSAEDEGNMAYWWREAAKDPIVGVTLSALRTMRSSGKR